MCDIVWPTIAILSLISTRCANSIKIPKLHTLKGIDNGIYTTNGLEYVPVFRVVANNGSNLTLNFKNEPNVLFFLDPKDAIDLMTELSQSFPNGNAITKLRLCVSDMREWFDSVDPSRKHIKGAKCKLVPSSRQLLKTYDYMHPADANFVPLFYSTSIVCGNRGGESKPDILVFFDFNDLISQINTLKSPIEREYALSNIKVTSLVDLVLDNKLGNVTLVPSRKSLEFCKSERYSDTKSSTFLDD
ncbi:hypothetical protein BEWA_001070 [Theileria equi strain WA]|uniref:Uncharacterized protein n=1 Tax=Theileria equi strain WA TaxID=1537102 RepID=L0AYQ8_THEEQ|nr:hypothetical protein BEWA_001070 [Theileria equi strain WA]AFZ80700.1 hypothetical protein BEWA_001070 [Theileria equi strain WA]|eukprot:XP_004830366.1 hypothetical protein BEWA_001070 [Theileria equi strain WA]